MALAGQSPFIGEWKLDASRSRTPDEMKVESKGGNTYVFDFGGGDDCGGRERSERVGWLATVGRDAGGGYVDREAQDGREIDAEGDVETVGGRANADGLLP